MAAELCSWFSGLIDNYLKLYSTVVYCCILFNKPDYILGIQHPFQYDLEVLNFNQLIPIQLVGSLNLNKSIKEQS